MKIIRNIITITFLTCALALSTNVQAIFGLSEKEKQAKYYDIARKKLDHLAQYQSVDEMEEFINTIREQKELDVPTKDKLTRYYNFLVKQKMHEASQRKEYRDFKDKKRLNMLDD